VDNGLSVKWNLNNLHPRWAIKYKDGLSKYISEGKIALIGCPIQSGSDRILRLMNRHHGIEEIANVLKEFKKIHPTLNLYTHFIVGFPSETEQEFMATINAVKDIGFDSALIFPYSDGCDSISSRMNEKIPEDIINERLKRAVNLLSRERITCKCDEA
jgi:tRNA A37 methylthiotransferase MiaB